MNVRPSTTCYPVISGIDAGGLVVIDGERSHWKQHIRSGWTQEMLAGGYGLIPGEYPGKPEYDGLHWSRPQDSFYSLLQRIAENYRLGARVDIVLADANSPENGFYGGNAGTNLYYQLDDVTIGGFGHNFNAFTISGPPRMRIVRELGTLTDQFVDGVSGQYWGGWTVARFGGAVFATDELSFLGYFVAENADGSLRLNEIPLFRHTATDFWLPDGGAMAGALPADGHYTIRRPGAAIVSTRDYDTRVSGCGSYVPGLLQKGGTDADAQNPRPTLKMLEMFGIQIDGDGISLDRVGSGDHPIRISGQHCAMYNVKAHGGVVVHGGSFAPFGWRNNTHGNGSNRRRPYMHDGIAVSSPHVYCDLLMAQKSAADLARGLDLGGGSLAGGEEAGHNRGHHTGQALIYNVIAGYGLATPLVFGSDSASFSMLDYASMLGHNVPALVHGIDNASFRLHSNGARRTGNGAGTFDLIIGTGEPGDPQETRSLSDYIAKGRNWRIGRPRIPAGLLQANPPIPAQDIEAYGCGARMYG